MTLRPFALVLDASRGVLIGAAEVVPGVSGGTVALVVGLYERLIASAGHVLGALRLLVRDVPRGRGVAAGRAELRQVEWGMVLPVLAAMLLALVTLARVIEPLLEEQPERARGLFLGLVLASVVVPARMVDRWGRREVLLAVVAAVGAVLLTGLPPGTNDEPAMLLVFASAALAICALVLPGVSGSFLLLSIGIYEPTLAAVNDRDLGYVAVFGAGALTGLALFVKVLQWLLAAHRRVTLAVMTGLMIGSLRALWPWQEDDRGLLAPSGAVVPVLAFVALGLALVAALLVVEARAVRVEGDMDPVPDDRAGSSRT